MTTGLILLFSETSVSLKQGSFSVGLSWFLEASAAVILITRATGARGGNLGEVRWHVELKDMTAWRVPSNPPAESQEGSYRHAGLSSARQACPSPSLESVNEHLN